MKKFLFLVVAAIGLLATACTKDEVAQPVGGEESVVTFTVEAPVMATRYGEGTTATELNWAVYDEGGNYLFGGKDKDGYKKRLNSSKTTVEIPFVNGMAYKILFWAESDNSPYTVDWDAKTVTYADGTKLANDENYDAFFCYYPVSVVTGPVTETVELKRPFAQLRIATNDTAAAALSGISVTDTKVTVANTYTAFDFVDGDVEGETSTVEFAYNDAAKKAVGQIEVGGNTYDLLTVNYLFGFKGDKKLIDATLTYKYGSNEVSAEYNSVPIQQNYRTNIVGSLLTSEGVFEVEIKEGFTPSDHDVEIVTVSSAQDLAAAIEDLNSDTGSEPEVNITLTDDIDLSDLFSIPSGSTRASSGDITLTVAAGRTLTLDLNGKKLTAVSKQSNKSYNVFDVQGTLAVTNGTIEYEHKGTDMGWSNYTEIFYVGFNGALSLNNVKAVNKGGSAMAYIIDMCNAENINVKVDKSTLQSTYIPIRVFNNASGVNNVTIKDSKLDGKYCFWVQFYLADDRDAATLERTLKFDIFNGTNTFVCSNAKNAPVIYGYNEIIYCDENGNQLVYTADELVNAAEAGGSYALANDIALENTLTISKDVTLDLNGKVLSGTCNASQGHLIMVNNGVTLNVKDSSADADGKITFAQGTSNVGWTIDLKGQLNLYSGIIELTGSWSIGYAVDVRPNAWGTAYTAPTTFNMYGGKLLSSDGAVRVASSSSATYANVSANFNMEGGEIQAAFDGIFVQQSDAIYDVLNVKISGGKIESDKYPVRLYGPVATGKVSTADVVEKINITGGEIVPCKVEGKTTLVEDLIYIGGGATEETLYFTEVNYGDYHLTPKAL